MQSNAWASVGSRLPFLPVDDQGVVEAEDVRRALRPHSRLISVMMANNETGVVQPVSEIGRVAPRGRGAISRRCGAGGGEGGY